MTAEDDEGEPLAVTEHRSVPMGPGASVLLFAAARPFVADADVAAALAGCRTFDTPAGHAASALAAGTLRPARAGALRAALAALVDHGATISAAEAARALGSPAPGPPPPAADLVLVTADRPRAAARCLRSFGENLRAAGRASTVRVFVDAGAPEPRRQYRAALAGVAREVGLRVRIADSDDKAAFAERLARGSGVSPEVARLAVLGRPGLPGRGPNHNAALLELAGGRFVAVDDDVVCEVRAPAQADDRLRIGGERWPARVAAHPDLASLREAGRPRSVDYLGLHERWLGTSLTSFLAGAAAPDLRGCPPEDLAPAAVVATCGSFYGDTGAQLPTPFLFAAAGAPDAPYLRDERAYQQAFEARTVWKGVDRPTLGRSEFLQGVALGLVVDPRPGTLTPPLVPFLRSADNLLGSTVHRALPGARLAHLPEAVWHAPVEPRRHAAGELVEAAAAVRWYDLMMAALTLHDLGGATDVGAAWLASFAALLRRSATMPPDALEGILFDLLVERAAQEVSRLEDLLAHHPTPAPWLARDIASYAAARRAWIARGTLTLWDPPLRSGGLPLVQALWSDLADLLDAWPALLAHAADARATCTAPLAAG